jgi:hypothetical protein
MRRMLGITVITAGLVLSMTGTASAAATVSPSSLSFGKQKVGTQSAPQQVTVTGGFCGPDFFDGMNIVPGPCFPEPTDVAVSGQFVLVSHNCPAALTSPTTIKATCTIFVAFKPTSKGEQKGFARAQSSPGVVGANLDGVGCKKKKKKNGKKKKLVCK